MNDDKFEISGEELTQFLREALEVEPIHTGTVTTMCTK